MRLLCVLFVPVLLLSAADQPAKKKAPAPAASKKTTTKARVIPKAVTIPKGAVKTGPYAYSYTDAAGKKWTYTETPFGVIRREDVPAPPAAPADTYADVTVTDLGDSVRFERPSAFGPVRWQRKKTELNDTERAVWEREQAKAAKQD